MSTPQEPFWQEQPVSPEARPRVRAETEAIGRESPAHPPEASGAAPPLAGETLTTGSGLGKYRVLDRLRSGPRATLYKARDILLDRLVTLKQLDPRLLDDPAACGRLRKEAYVLAQFSRDARYVVGVHEMIEEPRGLFLVMEYVPGPSLDTLIAKRQVSIQAALDILARVSLGLRSIHTAGVIHRDLAPQHIIMAPRSRPRIVDFSRAAAQGAEPDYTIIHPIYTAPEVLLGRPYDDRADIYSLGVIAYEMLVGRRALGMLIARTVGEHALVERYGELPTEERLSAWRAWQQQADRRWPDASRLNPQAPPILSAIITRMMAKSLEHRFTTIEDVTALLLQHFSQQATVTTAQAPQVSAAPPAAVYPVDASPYPVSETSPKRRRRRSRRRRHTETRTQAPHTVGYTRTVPVTGVVEQGVYQPTEPARAVVPLRDRVPSAPPANLLKFAETQRSAHPIRPRPRRWPKRALLSAASVALLVGGVYGLNRVYPLEQLLKRTSQLETLLAEGQMAYEAGRVEEALEHFRKAKDIRVKGLRMYEQHATALQWLSLSEARYAMNNGDLVAAEERLREASTRGMDRQILGPLRRDLIRLQSRVLLRQQQADGLLEAAGVATEGVEPGAFALPPTTDPNNILGSVESISAEGAGETDARDEREFQSAMTAIRDAMAREAYDEAYTAVTRASAIRQTPELDELSVRVLAMRRHAQSMQLGDTYLREQNYEEAAEQFREALRYHSSPLAHERLTRALALKMLEEGRAAVQRGDLTSAAHLFRNADWRDPMVGARVELERLQPALEAAKRVELGDRAADDGEWAAALELYEKSYDLLPPVLQKPLAEKIASVRRHVSISPEAPPAQPAEEPTATTQAVDEKVEPIEDEPDTEVHESPAETAEEESASEEDEPSSEDDFPDDD
jgi:serine/threonine protein kinase/tetratricopeptide (TPR) repeat protein